MLIVTLHNISPPDSSVCDYDAQVLVTVTPGEAAGHRGPRETRVIAAGQVSGHVAGRGWRALLRRVAEELEEQA